MEIIFENLECPFSQANIEGCLLGEVVHPNTYATSQSINFPTPAKAEYFRWLSMGKTEPKANCKLNTGNGLLGAELVGEAEGAVEGNKSWAAVSS